MASRGRPRTRAAQSAHYLRVRADRMALLVFLAAHGPIAGTDAAARLGWPLNRWWAAAESCMGCWDVTGRGLVLNVYGRAAVAGKRVRLARRPFGPRVTE